MAKETAIEWTDATWNPWHGCKKVSPGCKNCYMYRDKKRFGQDPTKIVRSKTKFNDPLKWNEPKLIFTCSWSDWFIEEADPWREEAWDIIKRTPQHAYQILTKRPERIFQCLPPDWGNGWPNVWLGVSVENQKYADERIPFLLDAPATIRFLSCEPLLDAIDLTHIHDRVDQIYFQVLSRSRFDYDLKGFGVSAPMRTGIHWVITGGESGPNARPMDLDWVRSIRDQCVDAGVPFFYKQSGGSRKIDGAWGGRILDGRTWDEMPRILELDHGS